MVKSLPAMQQTWVWSLGQEDPLEKEMATHPTILAWRTPWTEEPGGLQSMGSQRVGHNWNDCHFDFTWSRSETRFVFLASDASFSSTILDSHSDLPAVMVLRTVLLLTTKLIPLQRHSTGSMLMALTVLLLSPSSYSSLHIIVWLKICVQLFLASPGTIACRAHLSMGFPR